VLDAGCGTGRFLKWGAEFGTVEIIGVDLSHAVDGAYRNVRAPPNAHVVQADISALPFVEQFDHIFSVGVLHHMQSPKKGFSSLAGLLREEGRISIWLYSEENIEWVIRLLTPLRRRITSCLPKPMLYLLSHLLGLFLYACVKLIYGPANENRLDLGLGRLLPYNDYRYCTSRSDYASLVSVVFDHLVPRLAAYVSSEEAPSWFREANLSDVLITSRNGMSWQGQGTRVERLATAQTFSD
jgi:SAM-dependent methyltransferase